MKLDPLECLEKINHTVCLNYNNKTLEFNLDTYKDGPNNGPIDCDSIEEFADCYSVIYDTLAAHKEEEMREKVAPTFVEKLIHETELQIARWQKAKEDEKDELHKWAPYNVEYHEFVLKALKEYREVQKQMVGSREV